MSIKQVIEDSAKQALELDIQKRKQFIQDLVISHYQKAQAYANVTIAGSYAIFFTGCFKVLF